MPPPDTPDPGDFPVSETTQDRVRSTVWMAGDPSAPPGADLYVGGNGAVVGVRSHAALDGSSETLVLTVRSREGDEVDES